MRHPLTILTRSIFAIFLGWLAPMSLQAQDLPDSADIPMPVLGPNDTIPVPAIIHQNQWIPGNNLEWFFVSAPYPKHLLKKRQEWTRLRNAIYVTYPYARKAAFIINDINYRLSSIHDRSD